MNSRLAASILSHKDATPEMAERLFLHGASNESKNYLAQVAAASRAFTKQLFDKYKDNPDMLGHMTYSKHFNRWVDSVGIDKALEHPNQHVQSAVTEHPEFNNWVSRVGIDKALEHPIDYTRHAAAWHPEFNNWLKQPGNMDKALEHPSWRVRHAATEHPEFNNWLKQPGNMDKALNHSDWYVRDAARLALNEDQR